MGPKGRQWDGHFGGGAAMAKTPLMESAKNHLIMKDVSYVLKHPPMVPLHLPGRLSSERRVAPSFTTIRFEFRS
jgi:hypothetical protein